MKVPREIDTVKRKYKNLLFAYSMRPTREINHQLVNSCIAKIVC